MLGLAGGGSAWGDAGTGVIEGREAIQNGPMAIAIAIGRRRLVRGAAALQEKKCLVTLLAAHQAKPSSQRPGPDERDLFVLRACQHLGKSKGIHSVLAELDHGEFASLIFFC